MKLKHFLKKYNYIFIIFPLLLIVVIAVAIGEESEIIKSFFELHYLFALALYLVGLREIANPIRLGWGTTRNTIYFKFSQKIIFMISLFIIVWLWFFLMLTIKYQTNFFTIKHFKEILSLISVVLLMSQLGLLLGNLSPLKKLSTIIGIILLVAFAFLHAYLSVIISLIIAIIALCLVIVNYRLVHNINILRFYK